MVAVVVVDLDAVPLARQLEAALDAGELSEAGADDIVGDAGFRGDGDGCQCVQRVVVAGNGDLPAGDGAGAARHAR